MPEFRDLEIGEHERDPLPIVGDGAVANKEVTGGVLVPAVVLEIAVRPDVVDLLKKHMLGSEGEVRSQWGRRESDSSDRLTLVLEFERPARVSALLTFDIDSQGGLVDQIMGTGRLFIFGGKKGDKPSHLMARGSPGTLIEVTTISDDWQIMWTDVICRKHNCPPDVAHKMQDEWRRTFQKKVF